MTALRTEVLAIGPAEAEGYLAKNTHNRGIKPRLVEKYAAAMARGEWSLNGEAIKFDVNGVLLDGENRLAAIVKSGVAIEALLVWDLAPESQDTMDHHAPRTLGDVLALHGEKNAQDLAATVATVWRIQHNLESQSDSPSPAQALALISAEPGIRAAVHIGDRVSARIGVPRGMAAGCFHVFAGIDAEDAAYFFDRLADGDDLPSDSPIYLYREWCLRELRGVGVIGRRPAKSRTQALMVKAWNAFRRGDKPKLLKWAVGGAHPEAFPKAA